jgi:hypothetical protein
MNLARLGQGPPGDIALTVIYGFVCTGPTGHTMNGSASAVLVYYLGPQLQLKAETLTLRGARL